MFLEFLLPVFGIFFAAFLILLGVKKTSFSSIFNRIEFNDILSINSISLPSFYFLKREIIGGMILSSFAFIDSDEVLTKFSKSLIS